MEMYFKGGKGITNPIDIDGKEIKEGNILSSDSFDPFFSKEFYTEHYPNLSEEQILERKNKPTYIVKKDENGIFFGEGLDEISCCLDKSNRLYLHDFRFKYTKVLQSKGI